MRSFIASSFSELIPHAWNVSINSSNDSFYSSLIANHSSTDDTKNLSEIMCFIIVYALLNLLLITTKAILTTSNLTFFSPKTKLFKILSQKVHL